ncbi:hypothetical protein B0H11DRAFT_2285861 [Mycena galericulata]|nr:hypothetical protein B0H11DRAFT_2285861 [Mycena galericulata]
MSTYWNAYPNFVHNPAAPLHQEFKLLAAHCGWGVRSTQYKTEWARCAREEFGYQFGRDDNRLAGWQAMCVLVGMEDVDVPDSITRCKQALRNKVWVNIYDLIDAKRTGRPVKKHASGDALRKYTKKTKKIFPKAAAKGNPFLKVLLVEMFL